jgi:hypothetical protein
MGLIERIFRKRARRFLEDPDFGPLEERSPGSWEGQSLNLWGYSSIQVMIDADPEGPSTAHRSFLRTLRSNPGDIRSKIESAIARQMAETTPRTGPLKLTSIFFPHSPEEQTWRVWYDVEGEEHYWYGAEITKWQSIVPFAED